MIIEKVVVLAGGGKLSRKHWKPFMPGTYFEVYRRYFYKVELPIPSQIAILMHIQEAS